MERTSKQSFETVEESDAIAPASEKHELGAAGKASMSGPRETRREGKTVTDQSERIKDVPVSKLPWPENIREHEDFEKISYEDALRCTNKINEMQPLIKQGYKSDDFARLDRANGKQWENGQQRIYDLYYGSDPIRLYKDGATYLIDKGRHRVYAAKVVGIPTVPAEVREMKRDQ